MRDVNKCQDVNKKVPASRASSSFAREDNHREDMEVQEDDQEHVTVRNSVSSSIDSRTSESVVASTSSSMPSRVTPSTVERGASSELNSPQQQRPNSTGSSSAGHPEGDSNGVQSAGSGTARTPSLFHLGQGLNYDSATNQVSRAVPREPQPGPSRLSRMNRNQCPLCNQQCSNIQDFNEHIITHATICCVNCDFSAENSDEVREHWLNVHGNDYYQVDEDESCPTTNARGKTKRYKCKWKKCRYTFKTQKELRSHISTHIDKKMKLKCLGEMCRFVTVRRHHFEYHIRKHANSKPFKCKHCIYSCATKSMLSSHLKSHSNVFTYNCQDCKHRSKHRHDLKKHLRKTGHKPDLVLNPDGTQNPDIEIDWHGTLRGPKTKNTCPLVSGEGYIQVGNSPSSNGKRSTNKKGNAPPVQPANYGLQAQLGGSRSSGSSKRSQSKPKQIYQSLPSPPPLVRDDSGSEMSGKNPSQYPSHHLQAAIHPAVLDMTLQNKNSDRVQQAQPPLPRFPILQQVAGIFYQDLLRREHAQNLSKKQRLSQQLCDMKLEHDQNQRKMANLVGAIESVQPHKFSGDILAASHMTLFLRADTASPHHYV